MPNQYNVSISITADSDSNANDKVAVLKNLLENLTDKDFKIVKEKITKKPSLFKGLVKYLKFI